MRPTFIIGYKRSGTTLLRLILDSHRDITCPSETYLLKHLCHILQDERCTTSLNMLNEDWMNYLEFSVEKLLRHYAHKQKKKFWAEKTTENIEYINEIFRLFDRNCLFLWIVRNPLDVIFSVKELHPDLDEITIAKDWVEKNMIVYNFAQQHPEHVLLISYEQLCHHPSIEIKKICDFLLVDVDKHMWNPYSVEHSFLYDDPKINNYECIKENPSKYIDVWSKEQINRLQQIVVSISRKVGY